MDDNIWVSSMKSAPFMHMADARETDMWPTQYHVEIFIDNNRSAEVEVSERKYFFLNLEKIP